jgi:D-tyrosyl-tRNA(Tyr) deacylase
MLFSRKFQAGANNMRVVFQRVKEARVRISGQEIAHIGYGALILLGVENGDTEADAAYLAEKCAGLRVFDDNHGKLNLSIQDIKGEFLIVSQFTLLGDCRKGRRPSYIQAAPSEEGRRLYGIFCSRMKDMGVPVQQGRFQAEMDVELINHGPVTLLLDSKKAF